MRGEKEEGKREREKKKKRREMKCDTAKKNKQMRED